MHFLYKQQYLLYVFLKLLAYDGDFCENDADGCSEISCFNSAKCEDNKAPAIGGTCPACPSGYTGDGSACIGMSNSKQLNPYMFLFKILMNALM